MSKGSVFTRWQPIYAEHGIATFPVEFVPRTDGGLVKKPMVSRYGRFGLRASGKIAEKFNAAEGIGASPGLRNGFTVADVDEPGDRALQRCLKMFGDTPVIAESTATRKHHLFYGFNGEKRTTRPLEGMALDILGHQAGNGNFVVLPPSRRPGGEYRFIRGSIDDFHKLPAMRNVPLSALITSPRPEPPVLEQAPSRRNYAVMRDGDGRNYALWERLMRVAHGKSFDDLLALGYAFNNEFAEPLGDDEVIGRVESAWDKTKRGENRFGRHGTWSTTEEVDQFISDQDAFWLLSFLRAHNGPDATFMCANGLSEKFRWDRRRVAAARVKLIELGRITSVRQAGRGTPALYRWPKKPPRTQ